MNVVDLIFTPTSASHLDEWPDRALAEMALRDRSYFAFIFRKYAGPVHQYCDRCLGSREAAEDATQTVFMKAFSAFPTFRDPENLRPWLFTIAHNVIIDARRAQRPERPIYETEDFADSAASPEELAISRSERLQIAQLLEQLPPLQREVVELRLQGMSDREIACILGKSHQAIRAAQHRALVQLRKLMLDDSCEGDCHVAA